MATATELNRAERRLTEKLEREGLPAILVKRQVAELLQVSTRQVELLTKAGKIPAPIYISSQAPRWRRDELFAALGLNGVE